MALQKQNPWKILRITSYNVCYTKLLRTSETSVNPTGIDVGLGVKISGVQKNFLEGDLKLTSNTFDLAIEGKGFFQITNPNGEIVYTRNGGFKVDNEGNIVNAQGYLLEPQITIPDNVKDVTIALDGTVTRITSYNVCYTKLLRILLVRRYFLLL